MVQLNCHVCDRGLSETEVVWNKEGGKLPGTGAFEPCSTCLEAAMEAAYTDGFVRGDEEKFEELGDLDVDSDVETLEVGSWHSHPDQYKLPFHNEDSYE
jgi:hypothetical protein